MDQRHPPSVAASLLLVALMTQAGVTGAVAINNGDFATGDFTGWITDTDGAPGSANDFRVVGPPGDHSARIQADYWSLPGDIASTPQNAVLFANTLSQALDTTLSAGALMRLTFNWLFTGEDGNAASGDIFAVALNDGLGNLHGADGLLGFLIDPVSVYGSGTFSAVLDRAVFGNQSGWFLDLQLGVGVDALGQPNGLGSTVEIANITLTEFFPTPIPPSLTLLLPGLALLARRRPRTQARSDLN